MFGTTQVLEVRKLAVLGLQVPSELPLRVIVAYSSVDPKSVGHRSTVNKNPWAAGIPLIVDEHLHPALLQDVQVQVPEELLSGVFVRASVLLAQELTLSTGRTRCTRGRRACSSRAGTPVRSMFSRSMFVAGLAGRRGAGPLRDEAAKEQDEQRRH